MEINATSSNPVANAAVQAQRAQQAQQSQQSERRESRGDERVEQQEQAPRPVTNAQGQTTGTLINVTA